jgi:hypothetical protein
MNIRLPFGFVAAALLAAACPAHAQSGPTSWAQSVKKSPSVTPGAGDVFGFVHNGDTAQTPTSTFPMGSGLNGTFTCPTITVVNGIITTAANGSCSPGPTLLTGGGAQLTGNSINLSE